MLPLKSTALLTRCSDFRTFQKAKESSTCFLIYHPVSFSFLQKLSTLLTKQFLVPLETITLQEDTTV